MLSLPWHLPRCLCGFRCCYYPRLGIELTAGVVALVIVFRSGRPRGPFVAAGVVGTVVAVLRCCRRGKQLACGVVVVIVVVSSRCRLGSPSFFPGLIVSVAVFFRYCDLGKRCVAVVGSVVGCSSCCCRGSYRARGFPVLAVVGFGGYQCPLC